MPNTPAEDTASTSFTLPQALMDALESKAESEMTNKSDIIRRALMNYLTPEEQDAVRREMKPSRSAAYQEHRPSAAELNDKPSSQKPTIVESSGQPVSSKRLAELKALAGGAFSKASKEDQESTPSHSTGAPTASASAHVSGTSQRSRKRIKSPTRALK